MDIDAREPYLSGLTASFFLISLAEPTSRNVPSLTATGSAKGLLIFYRAYPAIREYDISLYHESPPFISGSVAHTFPLAESNFATRGTRGIGLHHSSPIFFILY
jgi:hypothetical protein